MEARRPEAAITANPNPALAGAPRAAVLLLPRIAQFLGCQALPGVAVLLAALIGVDRVGV
jgi:hypothetical protein